MLKGKRFDELQRVLRDRPDVAEIELDEDFIPPHKQAGFIPYDVILHLDTPVYGSETEWDEDSVTAMLHSNGLEFDRVINVEDQSNSELQLAFVSLQTSEEAFSR